MILIQLKKQHTRLKTSWENKVKTTKKHLKRIIKEEYRRLVKQGLITEATAMSSQAMNVVNLLITYAKEKGIDENKVGYSQKPGYNIFNITLDGKKVIEIHTQGNIYGYFDKDVKQYFYDNDAKLR